LKEKGETHTRKASPEKRGHRESFCLEKGLPRKKVLKSTKKKRGEPLCRGGKSRCHVGF